MKFKAQETRDKNNVIKLEELPDISGLINNAKFG